MDVIFTIVSRNYAAQAATLMESLALAEPKVRRVVVATDGPIPALEAHAEVIDAASVGAPFAAMCVYYDALELNTAVKPYVFKHLLAQPEVTSVTYLDPDIYVYRPLDGVREGLAQAQLVLTPHVTRPLLGDANPNDQAILRSTGIATSQSTTGTEEAKDFKVVVTLDNPTIDLRPGLSSTAKILTAEKKDVLSIPIQALTMRRPSETVETAKGKKVEAAVVNKEPQVQGVFVLQHEGRKLKAHFVPVNTGITGTTDIEVTSGLKAGDEIVTGSYKTLRELKSGALVKPMDANAAAAATSTT